METRLALDLLHSQRSSQISYPVCASQVQRSQPCAAASSPCSAERRTRGAMLAQARQVPHQVPKSYTPGPYKVLAIYPDWPQTRV